MRHSSLANRFALASALVAGMSIMSLPAMAQSYPTESVKMIVPVPAGGVTDLMARLVAQGLNEMWNVPVVVENRPGGNYGVGTQAVARSKPDGYTLLVSPDSTFTANPFLSSKLTYKMEEFTSIALLSRATPMLVVNANVPAKSVSEFIALAKAKPGELNYGSYGLGTYAHLGMEDFKRRTQTNIVHVPYSGAAPALEGLLRGDVSALILNLSSFEQHEASGKLRILASASAKRSAARPTVETMDEAGLKGFETSIWFGLFGPAGMPDAVVKKISEDVAKVLASPKVMEMYAKNSFTAEPSTPAQFTEIIRKDSQHWNAIIQAVGVKLD